MSFSRINTGFERIEKLIQNHTPSEGRKRIRPPTRLWLLAEEVGTLTATPPNRWLRECKNNEWAVKRALIDMKEATPRSRVKLFQFLLKKYKEQ